METRKRWLIVLKAILLFASIAMDEKIQSFKKKEKYLAKQKLIDEISKIQNP